MTNLEIYNKAFRDVLRKNEDELPGLKYRSIPLWDSVGHMDLVAELEEKFKIQMETQDMLAFSSYELGKEVLGRYGVVIE